MATKTTAPDAELEAADEAAEAAAAADVAADQDVPLPDGYSADVGQEGIHVSQLTAEPTATATHVAFSDGSTYSIDPETGLTAERL